MSFLPKTPSGSDEEARFMQWAKHFIATRLKFRNSDTVRWSITSAGIFAHAAPARGGSVGGLSTYRVKSRTGEYLVCRTWDGTTEGSTDVKVAKSFSCRRPTTETLGGVVITYAYTNGSDSLNDSRTATGTGVSETQMVVPYWTVDGVIAVATIGYSGVAVDGADLKLIEVSARCWAQV